MEKVIERKIESVRGSGAPASPAGEASWLPGGPGTGATSPAPPLGLHACQAPAWTARSLPLAQQRRCPPGALVTLTTGSSPLSSKAVQRQEEREPLPCRAGEQKPGRPTGTSGVPPGLPGGSASSPQVPDTCPGLATVCHIACRPTDHTCVSTHHTLLPTAHASTHGHRHPTRPPRPLESSPAAASAWPPRG